MPRPAGWARFADAGLLALSARSAATSSLTVATVLRTAVCRLVARVSRRR